jgi:hypothetical protein
VRQYNATACGNWLRNAEEQEMGDRLSNDDNSDGLPDRLNASEAHRERLSKSLRAGIRVGMASETISGELVFAELDQLAHELNV